VLVGAGSASFDNAFQYQAEIVVNAEAR